jgi:hypothetical protein
LKKNKEVKDYIETYGQPTVEIVSGLFVEGFAGALIPGVTSFISAARGRRLEKNMEIFMNQISNDIYELKTLFNELDSKGKENFKNDFSEIILDYISEERDEEKIEFITNGFKKLLDKEY